MISMVTILSGLVLQCMLITGAFCERDLHSVKTRIYDIQLTIDFLYHVLSGLVDVYDGVCHRTLISKLGSTAKSNK